MTREDKYTPEWLEADIPPEEAVKIGLAEWIETDGDADVYWEKEPSYWKDKPQFRRPTFRVTDGSGKKPDLLIKTGKRTFAVEVKDAEDTSSVHTGAVENFVYWKEYSLTGTEYIIESDAVDIDAFLLATQYSPEGSLFKRFDCVTKPESRNEDPPGNLDPPVWFIPQWEYHNTKGTTRSMWRQAKYRAKEEDGISWGNKPGIGTLLSGELDWETGITRPSDIDPFQRVRGLRETPTDTSPKALYKKPVIAGNPIKCHNWRWSE